MIGAGLGVLIAACSTANSPNSGTTGSDPTPEGTTPTSNPGLVGCDEATEPLGCFATLDGKSYPTPATTKCGEAGAPASGPADTHCKGVTPQTVTPLSCSTSDAGAATDTGPTDAGEGATAGEGDAGAGDAAAGADAGKEQDLCGENGPDYGATMYGTEGNDDDCKYHTSYTATPICENDGVYFVVTANYLTRGGAPLTEACTYAELCLNNTHVPPPANSRPPSGNQQVVEGPPGTYTVGPLVFDAPGRWTVRFHFNEICCDVVADSPHGHAAYFVDVP
jgi:hypothetical protein